MHPETNSNPERALTNPGSAPSNEEHLYRALFERNVSVMLLIDPDSAEIQDANASACNFYGHSRATLRTMRITDINVLSEGEVYREMEQARIEQRHHFNFQHQLADGTVRDVEVFSGPVRVGGRSLLCSSVYDTSERMAAEAERERLISELRQTLHEVKTLRGFIPICASCKKIRDDQGFWEQIEVYIEAHSAAQLSHGLCPDCLGQAFGQLDGLG